MKYSPRPHNLSVAPRLAIVVFAVTFCSSGVFASAELGSVTLKIHRDDGTFTQYRAYSERAVKLLFPAGEATFEPVVSPEKWKISSATILKKIQTVRVSDRNRGFNVMGVTFGDQLFIFDGILSGSNSVTMSQLMHATASSPRDEAEALEFAKLYLALSYYRLADPDQFVAYKGSDSTKQNGRSFSDMIGVSHSPQIVQDGATYSVDFYSYDPPGVSTRVSHWQIDVGPENLEERLSAHHEEFRQLHSNVASEATNNVGEIKFSLSSMADGFTDDGARTDIQSWASSDGPGVVRIHFYYKSHEKAEKRMHDYVLNAVAIIETRPWLDSHGRSVGTQALMIRINDSGNVLIASQISEDESSVLEISCASLSNLLAAVAPDR